MATNRRWAWLSGLGAALAVASGCCCPGKGIVLRGDWSLQLNRISFISSDCVEYEDCGSWGQDGCCDGGGGGGMEGADAYGPETPYYHPKFHPVPTQPVYGPQPTHAPRPTRAAPEEMIPPPPPRAEMGPPAGQTQYRARRRPTSGPRPVRQAAAWMPAEPWDAEAGASPSRAPRRVRPGGASHAGWVGR